MPFDPGVIREIQAKVDLLAYVSQYVTLKKQGREYAGLCPFHSEKTPSFNLNAEKQVWHCHGCGLGGDLIKFAERYENVDFSTALRMLAQRAGVTLVESESAGRRRSERESIYEANSIAQSYFAGELRKDRAATAYLEGRGITKESATKFGIGFAPDSWDGLTSALARSAIDLDLAAAAGLVRARPQGDGYYDFFRNRLMLPVFNLTGEVMAFGGRALGDDPPKYLNTPNTAVYTKGRHVYALNIARRAAAADNALIVVEGYLDAIALHQAGFGNTVASLGTAFTPEQARELRRVAPNLYLCFDGDAAGQAATARSIDMLVEEGLSVEVVAIPGGDDPDEFVREHGAEAFRSLLDASMPWKDFKLDLAFKRSEEKFSDKSDIAKSMMQVVAQERDPIVRDQYVKKISRRLDIGEQVLRRVDIASATPTRSPDAETVRRAPPRQAPQAMTIERELIRLLCTRPSFVTDVAREIDPLEFEDASLGDVYARLLEHRGDLAAGLNPIALFSDDPMGDVIAQLALSSPPLSLEDDAQRFSLTLERFARRRMERRLSKVDEELNQLLTHGRLVPDALREEHNALATSLRSHKALGKEG